MLSIYIIKSIPSSEKVGPLDYGRVVLYVNPGPFGALFVRVTYYFGGPKK